MAPWSLFPLNYIGLESSLFLRVKYRFEVHLYFIKFTGHPSNRPEMPYNILTCRQIELMLWEAKWVLLLCQQQKYQQRDFRVSSVSLSRAWASSSSLWLLSSSLSAHITSISSQVVTFCVGIVSECINLGKSWAFAWMGTLDGLHFRTVSVCRVMEYLAGKTLV